VNKEEMKNFLDTLPHMGYIPELTWEINGARELNYWITAIVAEYDISDHEARKLVWEWIDEKH
jgi:hypothetical protein